MDILDLVADYVSQGLAIFPCRGKTPLIPGGFKAATKDAGQARKWWTQWPDANIGMATGAVSGFSILDVDKKDGIDGWETLRQLEETHGKLPVTRQVTTPRGGAHLWFAHQEGWHCSTSKLGPCLDTRGDGGYVIIPPSKGINGGAYEWVDGAVPFAEVSPWVLAGIAKRGPGRPPLPQTAKAPRASSAKISAKLPRTDIESALHAIDPNCDYQMWLEIGMALHSWDAATGIALWDNWSRPGAKYDPQACADKWASFGTSDGIGIATLLHHAKAAGWLGPAGKEIELYNRDHAMVLVSGKAKIVKETPGLHGRVLLDFLAPEDFAAYYRNRIIWGVSPQGKSTKTYTATEWLEWKGRRSYEGMAFAPSGKCPPNLYNMFRGLGCDPKPGDWSLMREHLLGVICDGNSETYEWLEAWLARIVQEPGGDRPGTSIVLKGGQGTGKGMFVNNFGRIVGPHFIHLTSQDQLTAKFNAQFADSLLVFADESCYPGDKAGVGRLKGLITEPQLTIEHKGVNSFQIDNHVNLIMASNEDWVVPADWDDRRFCVLQVSDAVKQNHAYFQALADQMNNGGREAWLHHLLTVDCQKANLREAPKTEAKAGQIVAGLDLPESYWYECVTDEQIRLADAEGRDTTTNDWPVELDKDSLFQGFLRFCADRKARHVPTKSWFFRVMGTYGLAPLERRDGSVKMRLVSVPTLAEARTKWGRILGVEIKHRETTNAA